MKHPRQKVKHPVRNLPGVVPKVELGQIQVHVLGGDVNVRSAHAPLEV